MTPPDGRQGDNGPSRPDPSHIPERQDPFGETERPVFGPPRRDLNMGQRYSRWALWGCATLALVVVLLGGGFLLVAMQQPGFGTWVTFTKDVTVCREHLIEVSGALGRYQTDKGKLPASLEYLYPTYLAKKENLYCPADPKAPGNARTPGKQQGVKAGTSYVLVPGRTWGSGNEVLVYCAHHPAPKIDERLPLEKRRHHIPMIRQDGMVDAVTAPLVDLRRKIQAAPPEPAP